MAYTVTRKKTVFGDMRAVLLEVTADAATQNIETGLSRIVGFDYTPVSMTTIIGPKLYPNSGAGGTAIGGVLGVSGLASGDRFFATVYGT